MSRLDDLLQTLCPDGVEYKELAELAEIGTGNSNRVDANDEGKYPFFVRSKQVMRSNKYDFDEEAIVIPGEGGIGEIFHYVHGKYDLHQRAYRISFRDSRVNTRFAYYFMMANFKKFITMKAVTATVVSIRMPMIASFLLPLPPLPVQEEIVRILDTFSNVVVELEAEQAARVRQYEHYRNELLSFDSKLETHGEYRLVKIKDIARRNHGTNITANRMKELHKENGLVRVFAGGSTLADVDYSDIPLKDIINETSVIVKSRGYIGFEYYEKPFSHKNEFWSYTFSKECNPKFFYYFLLTKTDYFQQKARASSVKLPQLTVSDTDNYLVPLPPLEVQDQIVSMLDRFDALVNDLKTGLPAEIALRRKQYEYYRDKLLTFTRRA